MHQMSANVPRAEEARHAIPSVLTREMIESRLVEHGLGHYANRVGEDVYFLPYGVEIVAGAGGEMFGVRYDGPPDDRQTSYITKLLEAAFIDRPEVKIMEPAPKASASWTKSFGIYEPENSALATMHALLMEFHNQCLSIMIDGEPTYYTVTPMARRAERVLEILRFDEEQGCPTRRRLAERQLRPLLLGFDQHCITLIDPVSFSIGPYDDRRPGSLMMRTAAALHGATAVSVLASSSDTSSNDVVHAAHVPQDLMQAIHEILGQKAQEMINAGANEDLIIAAAVRVICDHGGSEDLIALMQRTIEEMPTQLPIPGFGESS